MERSEVPASGHRVIGLEGFELESTTYHARIDLIDDADTAYRGGPVAVAGKWGPDVWIDVTIARDDEEPGAGSDKPYEGLK